MILPLPTCTLRSFRDTDAEMLQQHADNPLIANNLRDRFPQPYTLAAAKAYLALQTGNDTKPQNLAITVNDQLVGVIGIIPQDDIYRLNAEIGYWVAESCWGKGIATDALLAMTDYAFSEFGVNRLYAAVFAHNQASQRVLEKCGFVREAILRDRVIKNGQVHDEYLFAKLKPR